MIRDGADDAIRRGRGGPGGTGAAAWFVLVATAMLAACRSREIPPAPAASASAAPSSSAPFAPAPTLGLDGRSSGDDRIEPAYPLSVPPEPLAARLCAALHDLPAARKATCSATTPGFVATSECTRVLSFSLRERFILLAPADVDRCVQAMTKAHEGCAWIRANDAPVPAACLGILEGRMQAGAACRSSLDCQRGLHCHGAGPTDVGRCGPPLPARAPCDVAVDSLAVYTRQGDASPSHPACSGYCMGRRCVDPLPPGSACKRHVECGRTRLCLGGRCAEETAPGIGQPCAGGDGQPGAR